MSDISKQALAYAINFNNYNRLGIAGGFVKATPTLAHASPATAPPGAKRLRKAKKALLQ